MSTAFCPFKILYHQRSEYDISVSVNLVKLEIIKDLDRPYLAWIRRIFLSASVHYPIAKLQAQPHAAKQAHILTRFLLQLDSKDVSRTQFRDT